MSGSPIEWEFVDSGIPLPTLSSPTRKQPSVPAAQKTPPKPKVKVTNALRREVKVTNMGSYPLFSYDCPSEVCNWSFGCFNQEGSFRTLMSHLKNAHDHGGRE